jgi:hypothetical protein
MMPIKETAPNTCSARESELRIRHSGELHHHIGTVDVP